MRYVANIFFDYMTWQVYVLGTSGKLGKWKVENGLRLKYVGDSTWEGDCLIPKADSPIKYRYCKVSKEGNIGLESGGNRELSLHSTSSKQEYIVMSDGLFRVSIRLCTCSWCDRITIVLIN